MTLSSLRTDRLTGWHLLAAAAMAALGVWAARGAWLDIYHAATMDEENSQIFLAPVVAAYLVWVRRMRLRHCKPTFRMIGPIIVACGWLISSFGFYRGIVSFYEGGAVVILIGCVASVLGKNALTRFLPAIMVLVFLVPTPGRVRLAIAGPLEAWTAHIAQNVLEFIGVMDTERMGNLIYVHGQAANIAEACNGLRMVFALIMVTYAFAFGMPLKNSVRFLILIASPLAAIFCNVLRILPTVWLIGMKWKYAQQFHDVAGWAMLGVAFLMLYGIIKLLQWIMIPVTEYTLASQ